MSKRKLPETGEVHRRVLAVITFLGARWAVENVDDHQGLQRGCSYWLWRPPNRRWVKTPTSIGGLRWIRRPRRHARRAVSRVLGQHLPAGHDRDHSPFIHRFWRRLARADRPLGCGPIRASWAVLGQRETEFRLN